RAAAERRARAGGGADVARPGRGLPRHLPARTPGSRDDRRGARRGARAHRLRRRERARREHGVPRRLARAGRRGLPAAGIAPPPWRWPPVEIAASLGHHAVFAVATGAAYAALERSGGSTTSAAAAGVRS